jgi:hypothetical protein
MARRPAASRRTHKARRDPAAARKRRKAPAKPDPLDPFIAAGARILDLKVKPAWMPAVRAHLRVTLQHGALVAGFALPDDSEPAPVFEA